jgi:hypothetical protein
LARNDSLEADIGVEWAVVVFLDQVVGISVGKKSWVGGWLSIRKLFYIKFRPIQHASCDGVRETQCGYVWPCTQKRYHEIDMKFESSGDGENPDNMTSTNSLALYIITDQKARIINSHVSSGCMGGCILLQNVFNPTYDHIDSDRLLL